MGNLLTVERGLAEGWFQPNELNGLCHCGCGRMTDIANESSKKWGYVKGQHYRYCIGHGKMVGAKHPNWKGGRKYHSAGYVLVKADGHPAADRWGYVLEHRLVMERVIGRRIEPEEVVHHINEVRDDNRPENLRLFSGVAEHIRHHKEMRMSAA